MGHAYCYGMITPSTVHMLREDFSFPAANKYGEIAATYASIGGEAVNSAIILAKLGLGVRLDGNWIHRDRFTELTEQLAEFGIDTTRLTQTASGGTSEIVIGDGTSRTVFGNYASFHEGPRQWNVPNADDVRAADIVCIDPYFHGESRQCAELCIAAGRPYVTLDCPADEISAQQAAAVVISHELMDRHYAGRSAAEVFAEYQSSCEGLVIFTFGSQPLWYARRGEECRELSPFLVDVVDSTGAGDAFRAGIAYGVLQGFEDRRIIEFASAVAACVCQTLPHTLHAPGLAGVLSFLRERSDSHW